MPQSNSELHLQKTSLHYVLADKYAANQHRGQLRIAMLAGDFWKHSYFGCCIVQLGLVICLQNADFLNVLGNASHVPYSENTEYGQDRLTLLQYAQRIFFTFGIQQGIVFFLSVLAKKIYAWLCNIPVYLSSSP